jgi:hypothetical protein
MRQPDCLPADEANRSTEAWICAVPAHTATRAAVSTADRLTRWEAELGAQQAQLEAAQVTLSTVRQEMQAQRLQHENTGRRLDERARELDRRARDLDLKHQKLASVARRVDELRAQIAAHTQARDERSATVVDDPRLAETQRRLQLHALERNRLAELVQDLKRERDFLERRVETLEFQAVDRSGQTRRVTITPPAETAFDRVPKHLEIVSLTPTRTYPAGWSVQNPKLHTRVRQRLESIWEYFTSPVDPNQPSVN